MIFGARFGPDGHFLAFSGWDYYRNPDGHAPTAAEIWDFSSGHKLYTLAVPGVGLQPTFSPDGRLLAFSGSSAAVSLWDAATGKLVRMLDERGDAAFSPDGRLLAVAGSTAITVHDVASGQLVRRFASRAGRVRFSPDGSLLAQSGPGSVSLRSTSTGEELGRLPFGPGDQMELFFPELGPQIAFAPAGDRLVAATSPPRVWDVATRRPLLTLAGHIGMVPGVAFGPDGRRIATAGADGTVRLWDAQTGAELAVLRGHTSIVSCVAFHPDGRALLSGGRQPGDVKIWDLTRPVEFGVLPAGGAWALAFDEHDRLKRIDHVGRIQTHDPETGQTDVGPRVDLIQKWISPGHLAAFSGDGRQVAAVSADLHSVKVFDARTGKEIAILGGLETLPRRLAFSADGHRVAAATLPGHSTTARVVRVWDARSGQVLSDFRPSSAGRQSGGAVALSADGRLVAFDDYSRTSADQPPDSVTAVVRVCDVMTSREQITVSAADGGVGCLAFSPDAVLLAASGENGHVLAWETATGRSRCEDHLDLAPLDLAFSPNSRRLAAVNREVVTIWDVQTGEGILTLRGSPPRPADLASNATLAWSHDGRWLAAVNWDGTVAVWDGEPHERPSTPGSFPQVSSARAYAWHLGEAEAARAGGQWAAAAFHLARVSATDPPDLATRERRGRLHLLRADWERAYADYAALFAATEPDGSQAWLDYARLLLLRHDYAGYGRLVPRMIAHCGTRSDLGNPQPEEAQASVLAPGGTNDPVALVLFAERACEDSRNAPSALWSLSLAHYRAAQSDKAIARTDQAIARRPDMARKYWPVLALAHAQLGHPDEARRWLAQARNWHQQEEQRRVSESAGFTTPEWADFEIIYREAAASVREHEPTGMKE
jgi:WD40 repeat protein